MSQFLALPLPEKAMLVLMFIGIWRVCDGVWWLLGKIPHHFGTIEGNTPVLGVCFRPNFTVLLWRSSLHFRRDSRPVGSINIPSISDSTDGEGYP